MGTTVAEYLGRLDSGRRTDLPETTAGTLRLDAREDGHTEHWYLTVADQHVRVTKSGDDADLVVRAAPAVLDRLASGETHVATALLRNELTAQGDIQLLMLLRRIFPGPAGARHPRELGRAAMAGREGRR
ncbi:SCP2 sterol-binding domain-containing protein [Micromonospora sp. CV4]|uniref:SCP2 sterol-binding domain-containing protein n=1 Tax=Micromonospora sp. CV4 TaxID=2478711 RepID=UPI000EF4A34C|nr:SCP2 sterol-binding domain-containing protein [Micromonospora sp. CV4]RLP95559.1 sterol-binding protein [Micromonospora sp. CV4]